MINLACIRPAVKMRPTGVLGALEMIDKRREFGKTHQVDKDTYRASTRLCAIHYREDYQDPEGAWHEIDLLVDSAIMRVDKAPYTLDIFDDRIGYSYTSRRLGHVEVELVEVDHGAVDNGWFKTAATGNQFHWTDVETDLDMYLVLRPLSVEIFKHLKSQDAPRHFRWKIREHTSLPLFRRSSKGSDDDAGGLEITTGITPILVTRDYIEYYYDEEWTGRVSRRISPRSRQKEWQTDPKFPVVIDATTSEDIVADADDCFEYNGFYANSYIGGGVWVWWNGYYNVDQHSGLRFQTLGIPQGAAINTATITVVAVQDNGQMQAKIYGDDVDSAVPFSAGNLPNGITKTAANITVAQNAVGTFTWNITNIVQSIISRGGWSSGNNIRFALLNQLTGANTSIGFYDYAQGVGNVAQLDVDFTPGGAVRQPRYGFTFMGQIPGIV